MEAKIPFSSRNSFPIFNSLSINDSIIFLVKLLGKTLLSFRHIFKRRFVQENCFKRSESTQIYHLDF
jgi:hypothetical protein